MVGEEADQEGREGLKGDVEEASHGLAKSRVLLPLFFGRYAQSQRCLEAVFIEASEVCKDIESCSHHDNPEGWLKAHAESEDEVEGHTKEEGQLDSANLVDRLVCQVTCEEPHKAREDFREGHDCQRQTTVGHQQDIVHQGQVIDHITKIGQHIRSQYP